MPCRAAWASSGAARLDPCSLGPVAVCLRCLSPPATLVVEAATLSSVFPSFSFTSSDADSAVDLTVPIAVAGTVVGSLLNPASCFSGSVVPSAKLLFSLGDE